jgi:glyoxylase-like metal-dependent hydrolase (beta-lactamase superfamily II)
MGTPARNAPNYEKGLVEVADGCFAYLQPDGGWGWSNAGLVVGGGESLLVDTLFDLTLTAEMLATMSGLTGSSPIRTLVNTHANGDHCFGNQLVQGAEIIAAERVAHEMSEVPADRLATMLAADLGPELSGYIRHCFGAFDFSGIETTLPTRTFSGSLSFTAAGRQVQLIEVGPAHTGGDTLIHLPETKTCYTGDILFVTGTPIVWAGPFGNWIAACDLLLGMDLDAIVPGHGPLTDRQGPETVRAYLGTILEEARQRFDAGMAPETAMFDIELGGFADLGDRERLAVNVLSAWRELDPGYRAPDVVTQFGLMAKMKAHLDARHGS